MCWLPHTPSRPSQPSPAPLWAEQQGRRRFRKHARLDRRRRGQWACRMRVRRPTPTDGAVLAPTAVCVALVGEQASVGSVDARRDGGRDFGGGGQSVDSLRTTRWEGNERRGRNEGSCECGWGPCGVLDRAGAAQPGSPPAGGERPGSGRPLASRPRTGRPTWRGSSHERRDWLAWPGEKLSLTTHRGACQASSLFFLRLPSPSPALRPLAELLPLPSPWPVGPPCGWTRRTSAVHLAPNRAM
jgi:hypothetical protein